MSRHKVFATPLLAGLLSIISCGCEATRWARPGAAPQNCPPPPPQNCPSVAVTDTTMGIQMSQTMDMQQLEVDYDELRRIMAIKEGRARAEALRQRRLPGLLQEQRNLMPNMPPDSGPSLIPGIPQTSASGTPGYFAAQQRQLSPGELERMPQDADIVVAIDQYGNPIEEHVPRPRLEPFEIPYVLKMRVNLNMSNTGPQSVQARNLYFPESPPPQNCCSPQQQPSCTRPRQSECGQDCHPTGFEGPSSAARPKPGLISPRSSTPPTTRRSGLLGI